MAIILDANILFKNRILNNSKWETLSSTLYHYNEEVYLVDVVLEEFMILLKDDVRKELRDVKGKIKYLSNFESGLEYLEVDVDKILNSYKEKLFKLLNINQDNILSTDEISIKKIKERALLKQKPFNVNGNGFKDNLIWEALKYYGITRFSGEITFVSENRKDFAKSQNEPETLADNLLTELNEINLKIKFFKSLEDCLEQYYVPVYSTPRFTYDWLTNRFNTEQLINPILDKLNSQDYHNQFLIFIKEVYPNLLLSDYSFFYVIQFGDYYSFRELRRGESNNFLLNFQLDFNSLVEYEVLSDDNYDQYYSYSEFPVLVERTVKMAVDVNIYIKDENITNFEIEEIYFEEIN